MAFSVNNFDPGASPKGVAKIMVYSETGTLLASMAEATYFDNTIMAEVANVGDILFLVGSDGVELRRVSANDGAGDLTFSTVTTV